MLNIAIIMFGGAVLFLALATWSFKIRAITNKKAWNGNTKIYAVIGVALFIVSLILLYLSYPRS